MQVGDEQARAAGIQVGQKLSTALGLLPELAVFERDAARERQALENLACWAGRFTPTISLSAPATLLLEIGACLRLFGGSEAIVAAALAGCAEQHYTVSWAAAPTPLGAFWLARANGGMVVDAPGLSTALAALPCTVPGWPSALVGRLESFGLKRLGDLRQLPGAGLRRRIGNGAVDELLRAWGDLPDPQKKFIFPENFAMLIELPARVEHADALVFAGQRLLAALAGWLAGRQLLLRRCTLRLIHDDGAPSLLPLSFAEASADEERFLRLLREHLGRLQLRAPVEALHLRADELLVRSAASAHLFEQAVAGEGAPACLERLRARLGEGAVQILALAADYRPECATQARDALANLGRNAGMVGVSEWPRPLWLLPLPQALAEHAGGPYWLGQLKLLSRPERLESGWWDEGEAVGDVRRDYFVARNSQGQWAWIFRDAEGWFLHGLFA